jgi:hypothetical protein
MLPGLTELSFQGDLLSDGGYQRCCSSKPPSIMTFMSHSFSVKPVTTSSFLSKAVRGGCLLA